jgi:hypothetical protein
MLGHTSTQGVCHGGAAKQKQRRAKFETEDFSRLEEKTNRKKQLQPGCRNRSKAL